MLVTAIEVLFYSAIALTVWFMGYMAYRLVTDESNR